MSGSFFRVRLRQVQLDPKLVALLLELLRRFCDLLFSIRHTCFSFIFYSTRSPVTLVRAALDRFASSSQRFEKFLPRQRPHTGSDRRCRCSRLR